MSLYDTVTDICAVFTVIILIIVALLLVPLAGMFVHWVVTGLFGFGINDELFWTVVALMEMCVVLKTVLFTPREKEKKHDLWDD